MIRSLDVNAARGILVSSGLLAAGILIACSNGPSGDPSASATPKPPLFGPGAHWIDEVTGGTVTFDAAAVVGVDVDSDGAADITVDVSGPTTVFRSDAKSGDASDPDHRNHLDLEIIDMTLTAEAVSFHAGDGAGNFVSDGSLFSIGTSDEIPGSPQLAHDSFEIFFEGEVSGQALHNEEPLRMVATIDRLPPIGNVFELDGPPLPLFAESGDPSGFQITSVSYTPLARR
jgi:hypothetical protein